MDDWHFQLPTSFLARIFLDQKRRYSINVNSNCIESCVHWAKYQRFPAVLFKYLFEGIQTFFRPTPKFNATIFACWSQHFTGDISFNASHWDFFSDFEHNWFHCSVRRGFKMYLECMQRTTTSSITNLAKGVKMPLIRILLTIRGIIHHSTVY